MKILGIITHNFPQNIKDRKNAGIFVFDIANELSKKNTVAVLCPQEHNRNSKFGNISIQNFPVFTNKKLGDFVFWNPIDIVRLFIFIISGFIYTIKFIKKQRIEINIVMWAFPSGLFAYFAKIFFKIPYAVWCLGSDIYVYGNIPIVKNIIKLILKSADFVCADGIDLSEKTTSLSGVKCVFIPSASKAKYIKNKKRDINSNNKIIIGLVARMEKVKGVDILLDALLKLKNDITKFEIHIVGDGSLLEKLVKKSKSYGIYKYITFYGKVSNFQRISEIIFKCDWLIIPSRSDSIPLVFSEAMKCKTPIIASDLSDLKYLINTYKVGLLFKKGSVGSLTKVLRKLKDMYKERNMFSLNTKNASRDFNIEKSAKTLLTYINLL